MTNQIIAFERKIWMREFLKMLKKVKAHGNRGNKYGTGNDNGYKSNLHAK